MSNCESVLQRLERRCTGKGGWCSRLAGGQHQLCNGKRARRAAIFQRELCEAILQGLHEHMRRQRRLRDGECRVTGLAGVMYDGDDEVAAAPHDYESLGLLLGLHGSEQGWAPLADDDGDGENDNKSVPREAYHCTTRGVPEMCSQASSGFAVSATSGAQNDVILNSSVSTHTAANAEISELHKVSRHERYVDDLTGLALPPDLCDQARAEELRYFKEKGVWVIKRINECLRRTGKPPISVRWVETNKGDDQNPRIRSRLVAREIRLPGEEAIFAPTPPLESLRIVLSHAVTNMPGEPKKVWAGDSPNRQQILLLDISRAYFNARTDDDDPVYVELPPELGAPPGSCGLLKRHMYGTRRAAEGWQDEYSTFLRELGFVQGAASACVFRHPERNVVVSVHGDDFTASGAKPMLDWFESQMRSRYELTVGGRLGPGVGDDKEATVLNRVVRWGQNGIEYEADPRQVERLVVDTGLEGSNGRATPGVRPLAEQLAEEQPLPEREHTKFRGDAARANYLSPDRPDVTFSAKEVCRCMSAPGELAHSALKHMVRYLVERPRLVFRYDYQTADHLDVYTDTDWAGCPRTRKSTSGGCLMLGTHLLKSWSVTQASVALSSGEAEFYGVVRGAGVGLGVKALFSDLGLGVPLRVWTDSSAAIGIVSRQGLGKLRHVECASLWVQQRARRREFELHKIDGTQNPADLFTKYLDSRNKVDHVVRLLACEYRTGRPDAAPQLKRAPRMGEQLVGILGMDVMPHLLPPEELARRYPAEEPAPDLFGEDDVDPKDELADPGPRGRPAWTPATRPYVCAINPGCARVYRHRRTVATNAVTAVTAVAIRADHQRSTRAAATPDRRRRMGSPATRGVAMACAVAAGNTTWCLSVAVEAETALEMHSATLVEDHAPQGVQPKRNKKIRSLTLERVQEGEGVDEVPVGQPRPPSSSTPTASARLAPASWASCSGSSGRPSARSFGTSGTSPSSSTRASSLPPAWSRASSCTRTLTPLITNPTQRRGIRPLPLLSDWDHCGSVLGLSAAPAAARASTTRRHQVAGPGRPASPSARPAARGRFGNDSGPLRRRGVFVRGRHRGLRCCCYVRLPVTGSAGVRTKPTETGLAEAVDPWERSGRWSEPADGQLGSRTKRGALCAATPLCCARGPLAPSLIPTLQGGNAGLSRIPTRTITTSFCRRQARANLSERTGTATTIAMRARLGTSWLAGKRLLLCISLLSLYS